MFFEFSSKKCRFFTAFYCEKLLVARDRGREGGLIDYLGVEDVKQNAREGKNLAEGVQIPTPNQLGP